MPSPMGSLCGQLQTIRRFQAPLRIAAIKCIIKDSIPNRTTYLSICGYITCRHGVLAV